MLSSYTYIGDVTSLEAKRWFLQILRSIQCEACVNCAVVPNGDFPIKPKDHESIILRTTCIGFLFFVSKKDNKSQLLETIRFVLKIDYSEIGEYRLDGAELFLKASIKGRIREFRLETFDAEILKKVVDTHFRSPQNELLARYQVTASHPIEIVFPQDSTSRDTETPLCWSPEPMAGSSFHVSNQEANYETTNQTSSRGMDKQASLSTTTI